MFSSDLRTKYLSLIKPDFREPTHCNLKVNQDTNRICLICWLSRAGFLFLAVLIASTAGRWRWPSDMHKILEDGMRSRMKDGHILGLVLMQKLMRDKQSDYPTIMLCIVTNTVSAILIFLVASSYWNFNVGFLIWALFLTCVWPHQLVLFGSHIGTSTMFFVLTLYFMHNYGGGCHIHI